MVIAQAEVQRIERRVRGVQAWLALSRATRAVEGHARQSVEAAGLGMSDFAVLEALLHKGPLSVGELGRLVLLTSGSMTAAVDRLEREHLVERTTTADDRRARIVHLTDTGSAFIRATFADHERDMERAFEPLSSAELRTLVGLLGKLRTDAEDPTT